MNFIVSCFEPVVALFCCRLSSHILDPSQKVAPLCVRQNIELCRHAGRGTNSNRKRNPKALLEVGYELVCVFGIILMFFFFVSDRICSN